MSALPSVFIVDDESDIAEILGEYLEEDFKPLICTDSVQAIAIIKQTKFDLIISDLHLPEVDGIEIIKICKKFQPNTPIIISTGQSEYDPLTQGALAAGAHGVLVKPFGSPDKLVAYLKKFVNPKT